MDTESMTVKRTLLSTNFTFNELPKNSEDLAELIAIHTLADPMTTAALWIVSMLRYTENREDGLAMIDVLKGPQPLSGYDKAFLKDRFMDKMYLPKVYFEGATPENGYTPTVPYTVKVYDDPIKPDPACGYVLVKGKGFDTPRNITLRRKGEEYYLWNYAATLMGVRTPKSENRWA